jgi:SAM-dependent methyltransferase
VLSIGAQRTRGQGPRMPVRRTVGCLPGSDYARAMPVRAVHDPAREEAELREYLGDAFELVDLRQSDARILEEFADATDEASFYRQSESYLYNLTAFAMTGTKIPYIQELIRHVPPGARILDYGCGIGSDGLMLLELGYRVEFADFANPSTEYLSWRLARRCLEAPIHDLDRHVPGGFNAAYSFDVIEHVDDPFGFLAKLERLASLVVVNFLEPLPDEPDVHHELPIAGLLRHASSRRLRRYRRYHGRSHLVLYEGRQGSRVFGAARIVSGRLRAQTSPR